MGSPTGLSGPSFIPTGIAILRFDIGSKTKSRRAASAKVRLGVGGSRIQLARLDFGNADRPRSNKSVSYLTD